MLTVKIIVTAQTEVDVTESMAHAPVIDAVPDGPVYLTARHVREISTQFKHLHLTYKCMSDTMHACSIRWGYSFIL